MSTARATSSCAALALLALLVAGCPRPTAPPRSAGAEPPPVPLPPTPWTAAAVAHGGAGTDPRHADGCRRAVDAALSALARGVDPLDAAAAGVVVLEDDPRYNAGTGSRVRLDGWTVQMDAALMDSRGRFGAVAALELVRNPVLVARAVIDTPHLLLVGDGATRFARTLGLPPYDPTTPEMRAATAEVQQQLRRADPSLPERWRNFDWRSRWNFERTLQQAGLDQRQVGSDTVGVAVRAADGRFAAALSTGGTSITLRGRVGDVPVFGAGLYAGAHGAAAATGSGERIIEVSLARLVHGWLAQGASAKQAAERATAMLKDKGWIGIVVVGPRDLWATAGEPMAWAGREAGSSRWLGP